MGLAAVSLLALVSIHVLVSYALLPAIKDDSLSFVEPAFNYCRGTGLISHTFPLDATGQDRFIWHGPLTPLLYAALAPGCSVVDFYYVHVFFLFLAVSLLILIFLKKDHGALACWGAASFTTALITKLGFRPEILVVNWILFAYLAVQFPLPVLEGVACAAMFWTSPVSCGLYIVIRIANGNLPKLLRTCPEILLGAVIVTVAVLCWYPYPLADLIGGVITQAKIIAGRSDGDIWTYFVRSDFVPLFGLVFGLVYIMAVSQSYWYLLLAPFIWWFGLRVPPTWYNVTPVIVLIYLNIYSALGQRARNTIAVSLGLCGITGLIQSDMRDAITVAVAPASYARTRSEVSELEIAHRNIVAGPLFLALTNPEITFSVIDGEWHPKLAPMPSAMTSNIRLFAENGSRGTRCPPKTYEDGPLPPSVGGWPFFKSTSGWSVFGCSDRAATAKKTGY